jgi:hypothetical protein
MKTTLLACTVLALTWSLPAASLPPADSFRVTVEEVIQSIHCRVVTMKIEARSAEMMAIRCENDGGAELALDPTLKGKGREGTVILASMQGERSSVCHTTTVLQGRAGGSQTSAHGTYDLPAGAKLESVIFLSVRNGLYKLNHPLVIGTRNGKTIRLTVGSWNQGTQK